MEPELLLKYIQAYGHLLYFQFILLPFFYIEAIYNIFTKPKQPKSVKGEVVLITGTGHGIGKLLANKYAQEGATVVGWDVNETLNKETIFQIKKNGGKAFGYKVDISNREEVMATAQKVREAVGDVTILINNAGIMPHHSFFDHTEAEIRKIIDVNTFGCFWTVQAFLPAMKRNNHGHVVQLCSMAGLLGLINLVPYCASKFAVKGMMESLHEEFRRNPNNKVHFTTIYPYMVDTGLCKSVEVTYPEATPMLKPEEVAEQVFQAQIHERRNVCVPEFMGYLITAKTTFWPQKASDYFTDHFKSDLLSDLDTKADENGKSSGKN